MRLSIDILEDDLLSLDDEILQILLTDHTTGRNIIWATNDYKNKGKGYGFSECLEVEQITGNNNHVIMPRIAKAQAQQRIRSQSMAEVFTPAWVCNAQNNLIDEAWFGQPDVFNVINDDRTWIANNIPIVPDNKSWKEYVKDTRLEMACGEAPYLVSRYDATNGEPIPVGKRIGMLDRKLWLIHNNTPDIVPCMNSQQRRIVHRIWRRYVYRAYQSVYGFEWQGDNLLLAREALFATFLEYYQAKWKTKKLPKAGSMKKIAEIISWNIWQMDGLTYGIPGQTPTEQLEGNLFPEDISPQQRYCRIKEWTGIEPLKGRDVVFKTLLNSKN